MTNDTSPLDLTRRLQDAIDKLHEDVRRVEVWAGALSGFTQPVPQYQPPDDFLLPRRPPPRANGQASE